MADQPTLQTERLTLRPFAAEDGPRVRELAGDRKVAETTGLIPHPYPEGAAEEWIGTHGELFEKTEAAVFAVTLTETGELVGAIGLVINEACRSAEIGYWIGVPFWNRGYGTEAARELIRYGFDELDLHRVFAHHFSNNPASGRIMEKIGMRYEGRMRDAFVKWDEFVDTVHYAILRTDLEDKES